MNIQFLDVFINEVMTDQDNYNDPDTRRGERIPIVRTTSLGAVVARCGEWEERPMKLLCE